MLVHKCLYRVSFYIKYTQHAEMLEKSKSVVFRTFLLNTQIVSNTKRRQERDKATHRWHSAENILLGANV